MWTTNGVSWIITGEIHPHKRRYAPRRRDGARGVSIPGGVQRDERSREYRGVMETEKFIP